MEDCNIIIIDDDTISIDGVELAISFLGGDMNDPP